MNTPNKANNNLTGIITAVAGAIVALTPVINTVADKVREKSQEHETEKERVVIPALYDKGFPLDLNQATEMLNDCGFKVVASKLLPREASSKYKDCFDLQVLDSNPKHKQKVQSNAVIHIRYITQDVIDESLRIFLEEEKLKEAAKSEKFAKRHEQKERVKELANGVFGKMIIHHDKLIQGNVESEDESNSE